MIRITGSFSYEGQRLFEDIDFVLEPGAWTCLLGPSGVGKSTLLRLLAGLETHGEFDGRIESGDGSPLDGRVAYMAQQDLLMPWLDVTGNVTLGARLRGETPDLARAGRLISAAGLGPHSHKFPRELSGGMRQRAALARTLMEDKPFVFLDEPFSALDARTRAEMQELAFSLLEDRTVLLVTHDPAEAARLGGRIAILDETGLREFPAGSSTPLRPAGARATLDLQARLLQDLRKAHAA
jgi:putative hydroxymethylpyrimidine transport system ATP-binding protein